METIAEIPEQKSIEVSPTNMAMVTPIFTYGAKINKTKELSPNINFFGGGNFPVYCHNTANHFQ